MFQPWIDIIADLRKARSARRGGLPVCPGWQPDGKWSNHRKHADGRPAHSADSGGCQRATQMPRKTAPHRSNQSAATTASTGNITARSHGNAAKAEQSR